MTDKPDKKKRLEMTETGFGRAVGEAVTKGLEAQRRLTPAQRASAAVQATTASVWSVVAGSIAQMIVGLLFMAGGSLMVWKALENEPHHNTLLYVGIGTAVFGGMIFPGIFPVAQKIVVLIFPNGIPLIGGKRKDDPPAPTAAPLPRDEADGIEPTP